MTKHYTCPMHPEVTSDKPGSCPKCGMNLVPVEETQEEKKRSGEERQTKMACSCC